MASFSSKNAAVLSLLCYCIFLPQKDCVPPCPAALCVQEVRLCWSLLGYSAHCEGCLAAWPILYSIIYPQDTKPWAPSGFAKPSCPLTQALTLLYHILLYLPANMVPLYGPASVHLALPPAVRRVMKVTWHVLLATFRCHLEGAS